LGEQGKADYFAEMSARNPARRIGAAEDVAGAVLYALTSTFLTGQTAASRSPERGRPMGLSWLQGPLATGAVGHFLVPGRYPVAYFPLDAVAEGVLALYASGFAPRWHVPRDDVDMAALTRAQGQTFCPYKGLCDYWDIGDVRLRLEPGQSVVPHGVDRDLTLDEVAPAS
jgi:hypothetical protein